MGPTVRKRTAGGVRTGVVAALVGGLLLTAAGCSAQSGGSSADGGRAPGAGGGAAREGGAKAPGGGQASRAPADGTAEGDQARDPAPPDYLSTFALDVDTASYGYARRTLADGGRPEPGKVRPEEFVNSFRQDYRRPKGNGFSVTMDGARAPEGTGPGDWSLLRVGLATGPAARTAERPPAALTFVVDVSGSMAEPGRLDLVRKSLGLLTDELRDDDSIALVTFSGEAETRLGATRVGGNRGRIHDEIDELEATDSTNVEAGITRGYDEAVDGLRKGANNRVVLLSDALANTGDTDADGILERVEEERKEYGITLFGVGVGSDYGDAFMEKLTNRGDGHTSYVSNEAEARKVFVTQLPGHIELRARDAKAQVAFDRRTVQRFRLIGYENRDVADDDFRDDSVDGGEVGPGHTVTALYAVQLREGARGRVAEATVRWLDPKSRAPHEESGTVDAAALKGGLWGEAGERLQVTAVAAYFAEALRGSTAPPGVPPLAGLEREARRLATSVEDGAVRQLADAIGQARGLGEGELPRD
ncbi:von Willebrand factor type A domain-containing protein [Streptomyces sp. NPDC050504]|uniref:vWA domain-containing protein n=1 Tax=Streptomyces sp. NPDC050504 TaxID=3365618 RepID=UPI0037B61CE7